MLIAEDSLEDTVFPRLEAAGADLARIHILKFIRVGQTLLSARLPKNLLVVEQIIQQTQSRLLVIEPGLADLDRHCLCLLAEMADRLQCAVVIQRYLNKLSGTRAICRGGGSMSVIGAARTALLIARDPREEAIRILASTKNNFGPRPASLRFVLEAQPFPPPLVGGGEGGGTCRVHWLGSSPLGADDLLAIQSATEAKTAVADAIKFLKDFLKDGPKEGRMCIAEANRAHIAPSTLRRAKLRIGVMHNKPRNLLGLFVPATWELPGGEEHEPPHSVSYGAMDESSQHNFNDNREIG
jgi:putative DNA primase/helicase